MQIRTRTEGNDVTLTPVPVLAGNVFPLVAVPTDANEGIGSVHFQLAGQLSMSRIVSTPPYSLFDLDEAGNPVSGKFPVGTYTLDVTTYSGPNGSGTVLTKHYHVFQVEDSLDFQPKITLSNSGCPVGHAVHVHACDSKLPTGVNITDVRFEWDFGEHGSAYNTLTGFNAAHLYASVGQFDIRLKMTLLDGRSKTTTFGVVVTPSARSVVRATDAAKLLSVLADATLGNVEIVLVRGVKYVLPSPESFLDLRDRSDVVIRAENGNNAHPPVIYHPDAKPTTVRSILGFTNKCQHITFQGIRFESAHIGEDRNCVRLGHPDGHNIAFVGCELYRVDGVNLNGNPSGFLMQNVTAIGDTCIKHYLCWAQGTDLVLLGNQCSNSVSEHIIRFGGPTRVLLHGNRFANIDRRSDDPTRLNDTVNAGDIAKGVLTLQVGSYIYVHANTTFFGNSGCGPLGAVDKKMVAGTLVQTPIGTPSDRTTFLVMDSNYILDGSLIVTHGAEHIRLRNNVIHQRSSADGIVIEPASNVYNRNIKDLEISNNTVVLEGTTGTGIRIGKGHDGINVQQNLVIAPTLVFGTNWAAAVRVDMEISYTFSGNALPDPLGGVAYAKGGANVLNGDYVTPEQWNAETQISSDIFRDVTLTKPTFQFSYYGSTMKRPWAELAKVPWIKQTP